MKKIISVFLIISFMGMNCASYKRGKGLNLKPDQKPGVDLIIQKRDGRQVKGELIAVKQNQTSLEKSILLLKEDLLGADVSVKVGEIKIIKIEKKSKALIGLLVGGAVGALVYNLLESGGWDDIGLMAIAFSSVPIGGLVGLALGKDQIIAINEKTLEDLRKKARVPDYN